MSRRKLIISIDNSNSNLLNELYENVRKMGGVNYIRIFKQSKIIKILYDDAAVMSDKILSRIKTFGVEIENFLDLEIAKRDEKNELSYLKIDKILIVLISIVVLFLSEHFNTNKYISFILYFVVILWLSYDFKEEIRRSSKIFNIHFITIIYFFSIFFYKILANFFPYLFRIELINWYEAIILVFIIYIGFVISRYLVSKLDLDFKIFLPKFFKIKKGDFFEKKDWRNVKTDDIVIYEKGDLVGCDAVIKSGSCVVDESLIRGIEISEKRIEGDKIYSGSFISDGFIEARIIKDPQSSLLFNIIKTSYLKEKNKFSLNDIPFEIYEKYLVLLPLIFALFILLSLKGFTGFLWLESLFISFFVTYPYLIWLIFPVSYIFLLSSAMKKGFSIKNTDSIETIVCADTIVYLSDKYIDYKTLKRLKSDGFELVLLSNKSYIEKELKNFFDDCYFNVDFEEKEGFVLKKKIEGKKIIGIGDCVYDLDTLYECDVSVVVLLHPESNLLPCDIVFLKKEASLVYELISYSRFIIDILRKNSFLVLFFHMIILPSLVLFLAFLNKSNSIENTIILFSFFIILLMFINSLRIYSYSKN